MLWGSGWDDRKMTSPICVNLLFLTTSPKIVLTGTMARVLTRAACLFLVFENTANGLGGAVISDRSVFHRRLAPLASADANGPASARVDATSEIEGSWVAQLRTERERAAKAAAITSATAPRRRKRDRAKAFFVRLVNHLTLGIFFVTASN